MSTAKSGPEILIVEDNPGDVDLIQHFVATWGNSPILQFVSNGADAIQYLRREGPFAKAMTPAFIVLDLNLPKLGGHEVLEAVKADPKLRHIPIAVFTSSESERDILISHQLHANCYLVKPLDMNQYRRIFDQIYEFWFTTARLPHKAYEE